MTHPYIQTLIDEPYNYKILLDKTNDEKYLYDCGEGIFLDIHIKKASMLWAGLKDGERVARKDFPAAVKEVANTLSKAFSLVKLEMGVPNSKYPTGDVMPEADDLLPLEPPRNLPDKLKHSGKVDTNRTQLVATKAPTGHSGSTGTAEFAFTDRQISAMKVTVAKGASGAQFEMFLYLAIKYKLDPFLKEIFFIAGNMNTILTSRDGYLKIAQNHKDFDGIRSMAVRAGDDFEIDLETDTIKHKFGKGERGPIIGAWAIVYRKGRRPCIAFADLSEYKGNSVPWNKYTSAMICKCAQAIALKQQFCISGLVTLEEMDVEAPEVIDPEFVTKDFGDTGIVDAEFENMSEEEV